MEQCSCRFIFEKFLTEISENDGEIFSIFTTQMDVLVVKQISFRLLERKHRNRRVHQVRHDPSNNSWWKTNALEYDNEMGVVSFQLSPISERHRNYVRHERAKIPTDIYLIFILISLLDHFFDYACVGFTTVSLFERAFIGPSII